uniref:Uncharacterized protein n=1 Tax=Solanum tuberosum TaxID=4113 RepID=M1DV72_SOLTU
MKKCNTWGTEWGVLIRTILNRVETKFRLRRRIMAGQIGTLLVIHRMTFGKHHRVHQVELQGLVFVHVSSTSLSTFGDVSRSLPSASDSERCWDETTCSVILSLLAKGDNAVESTPAPRVAKKVVRKNRIAIRSKKIQDPSANVTSRVILTIAPRVLNMLKAIGEYTILEEHKLSIDGVMNDYPSIWDTNKIHNFEQFTRGQPLYIPACVWEFYDA